MSLSIELLHQYTRLLDIQGADPVQEIRLTDNGLEEIKNIIAATPHDQTRYKVPEGYEHYLLFDGYHFYFFKTTFGT